MPTQLSKPLQEMTLRELLDAYGEARLARREEEMKLINAEIGRRQARGEQA